MLESSMVKCTNKSVNKKITVPPTQYHKTVSMLEMCQKI